MNALCSGCSLSPSARPSTVRMRLPWAWTANIRQDLTASLSRITVHAPQMPCSQPICVPVSPHSSRMTSTSVLLDANGVIVTVDIELDVDLLGHRSPVRRRHPHLLE